MFRNILNATLYINGILGRHRDLTTADNMNILYGGGVWILGQDQVIFINNCYFRFTSMIEFRTNWEVSLKRISRFPVS